MSEHCPQCKRKDISLDYVKEALSHARRQEYLYKQSAIVSIMAAQHIRLKETDDIDFEFLALADAAIMFKEKAEKEASKWLARRTIKIGTDYDPENPLRGFSKWLDEPIGECDDEIEKDKEGEQDGSM